MTDTKCKVAVLTPVGPGAQEIRRLQDLADSIACYEPQVAWFVLIDDSVEPRGLDRTIRCHAVCRVVSLANPRTGRGRGWSGGLAVGVMAGLRWILENTDAAFVVRLDTDSLVIGPFAEKIARAFDDNARVGMLGSGYRKTPRRAVRLADRPVTWIQKKLLRPFALWRRRRPWEAVQIGGLGHRGPIRRVLRRAAKNGYELGSFCQGGGYALRRDTLSRMAEAALLKNPLMWLKAPFGEDITVSVCVKAAGDELADFNDDGEVFGVQSLGLPNSPERLVKRGFSIIHSVTRYRDFSETDIRRYFRCRLLLDGEPV